jgi:hypothetical protein
MVLISFCGIGLTISTAAMSAVTEMELAGMDGVEAAGTLEHGEEKVFVGNSTLQAQSSSQN